MYVRRTLQPVAVGLGLVVTLSLITAVHRVYAQDVPMEAIVQFGSAHPQPAAPHHHVLDPAEVTIRKGGTVIFQVNGGAHGVAIYEVEAKTTRDDIIADLCPDGPGGPCVGATANPAREITDADNDVIVAIEAFRGVAFYDYAPGSLLRAIGGSAVFLNGSTPAPVPPATTPAPGVRLAHRFGDKGRFLVICTNRFHAVNDYMFGFVNVVR